MKQKRMRRSSRRRSLFLSLVIPLYNESDRLQTGLARVVQYLSVQPYSWEVILVDDGSQIAVTIDSMMAHRGKLRLLRLAHNYGKGRAIATGVQAAVGRYIIFSDIDLSVPIDTVGSMVQQLKRYPMVIASRRTPDATILKHQTGLREGSGRLFTFLSNRICQVGVADATCGMKGYRSDLAHELFRRSRINRWVFDTEILFLARKWGVAISELGVRWSHKAGSKVRLGDSVGSFIDLWRIRWFDWQGVYNRP